MTIYDWELSEPQYEFLENPSKFKAFLSARGAGKTSVGWMQAIRQIIENPGSNGVIVAPSFPIIDDVILPEMDYWLPRELIIKENLYKHNIYLEGGSIIRFRSADNIRHIERMRGLSVSWFWIDECTLTVELLWNVLLGGLRQPGFPLRAWLTGTPKPFSWVKRKFIDELTKIPDSYTITNVAIETNKALPKDYVESLRAQYKGRFAAQELDGLFVEFEGLIYPDFSETHVLDPNSSRLKPPYGMMFYAIDWGFRNPCAMLAMTMRKKEKITILEEFYKTHTTDDQLIEIAKAWEERYGKGPFYCDPSQPDSIAKFRKAGLNAKGAKNAVVPGIKTVTSFLLKENGLRISPFCTNLINELRAYIYSEGTDAPIKLNDHACDTLRYGLHSFPKKKPFFFSTTRNIESEHGDHGGRMA
jgi:PBSX family phage terminase large subunit